jgi:hypothetical protein
VSDTTTAVDLTADQRGSPRPTTAPGLCDAGAWEGQPPSAAPVITDTDPGSPSFVRNPLVLGTSSTDSVSIEVFAQADCAGTSVSGDRSLFGTRGIQVADLPRNVTSTLSARAVSADEVASACSTNFSYSQDDIALAPAITSTSPASGSNENSPAVIGMAEADSTVHVYSAGSCLSGTPLASGPQAVFAGAGLIVGVPDNSTTALVANYTDPAGNVSPCSSPFTYSEVTPAVGAPPPVTPVTPVTPIVPKKKCKKRLLGAVSRKCKKK